MAFVWSPQRTVWFKDNGDGSYTRLFGTRYVLSITTEGNYRLCDPDTGIVYEFDAASGLLANTTPPGGPAVANTIGEVVAGVTRVTSTTRSLDYDKCGVTKTAVEKWRFDYFTSDVNTGLLQYATLLRTDDSTVELRRLAMTYYQAGDSGGNGGDLQTVSLQKLDGSQWRTISTTLYRYYIQNYDPSADTQPGYQHGLKFVVGPEAYARVAARCDPLVAPDSTLAKFADYYYEFTRMVNGVNSQRVTRSVTHGGTLPHSFEYTDTSVSGAPADLYNNWRLECRALHADQSERITFSNYVCQPIVSDLWDMVDEEQYGRSISHTKYDSSTGRPTEVYTPAAVNMSGSGAVYDPTHADLNVQLNEHAGLVRVSEYADVTADDETVFPGYLSETYVKKGSLGTLQIVESFDYTSHDAGTAPTRSWIVLPAKSSNYPDGVTAVETDFDYAWTTGLQFDSRTTTLPQIPDEQNGEGVGPDPIPLYVVVEEFDQQGRRWLAKDAYDSRHEPDFIPSTQYAYDEPTGAVVRMVRNPGTPPEGQGPANVTTDYVVDPLGRELVKLGPWFNSNGRQVRTVEWTIYRDLEHEVWTAAGYATGSIDGEYEFTLVNPVSIDKMDFDGRTVAQIKAVRQRTPRTPHAPREEPAAPVAPASPTPDSWPESPGALSAGDRFPQSSYVRWTATFYNDAGDMTASRVYRAIPAFGTGIPGVNYDETIYGQDIMNRQNMTRPPGGTITRIVFDTRNNAVATYVGTNDAARPTNSPTASKPPATTWSGRSPTNSTTAIPSAATIC